MMPDGDLDVTSVLVDLAGVAGGATGDGALDQVTVHATDGDDSVVVTGSAGDGRGRWSGGDGQRSPTPTPTLIFSR